MGEEYLKDSMEKIRKNLKKPLSPTPKSEPPSANHQSNQSNKTDSAYAPRNYSSYPARRTQPGYNGPRPELVAATFLAGITLILGAVFKDNLVSMYHSIFSSASAEQAYTEEIQPAEQAQPEYVQQASAETPTEIPAQDQTLAETIQPESLIYGTIDDKFYLVDISSLHEWGYARPNLGLYPGQHELNGIPMYFSTELATQAHDSLDMPESYDIPLSISDVQKVYLLTQAGWGLDKYDGGKIGEITLTYDGGQSSYTMPLIIGENIRDWRRDNPDGIMELTVDYVTEAWRGYDTEEHLGGIDMMVLDMQKLSPDNAGRTLTGITITDLTSTELGSYDPAIYILGITFETSG